MYLPQELKTLLTAAPGNGPQRSAVTPGAGKAGYSNPSLRAQAFLGWIQNLLQYLQGETPVQLHSGGA
jgi:hypothetical protein